MPECNIDYKGEYYCNGCGEYTDHIGYYQFDDFTTIEDKFVPTFTFIIECDKCKEWKEVGVKERDEFIQDARRI